MPRVRESCVFPGRFQPPHVEHAAVLEELSRKYRQVVVAITGAHISHTPDDPFSGGERYSLLSAVAEHRGLGNVKIVPIPVDPLQTTWVPTITALSPSFDCVYCRNPLIASLFEHWGIPRAPEEFDRYVSGTRVRALMASNGDWRSLVPAESVPLLESFDCESRLKQLSGDQNM